MAFRTLPPDRRAARPSPLRCPCLHEQGDGRRGQPPPRSRRGQDWRHDGNQLGHDPTLAARTPDFFASLGVVRAVVLGTPRAAKGPQTVTSTCAISPTSAFTIWSAVPPGTECANRPRAGRREEPELAGRRRRHLRGELAGAVEQSHVPDDRHAVTSHDALDHCFLAGIDTDRQSTCDSSAHQPSAPSEIGTPTSEPYSVHEPS